MNIMCNSELQKARNIMGGDILTSKEIQEVKARAEHQFNWANSSVLSLIATIEDLQQSRDFYKKSLEIIVKKEQEDQCNEAEKTAEGKCWGYQKSEKDDEPTERCKECKQNISYEE